MSEAETPALSVIIPTYNRPAKVKACLAALARSRLPLERFEIVVVDDGSEPPLDLDGCADGAAVALLRQANGGPAKARNAGAARARAPLLVFTDDDCLPDPDWLNELAAAHGKDPEAALGGRCRNGLAANPYSAASQELVDFLYDQFGRGLSSGVFFTTNNFAVPAKGFAALGGFDSSFPRAAGEDREFCDRWRHAGKSLRYVPAAVIDHVHDLTLRRFWVQHSNYGRAAYHFHRLREARWQKGFAVERLSFYFELLWFPWRRHGIARAFRLSALLFISQLANALGFFRERAGERRR